VQFLLSLAVGVQCFGDGGFLPLVVTGSRERERLEAASLGIANVANVAAKRMRAVQFKSMQEGNILMDDIDWSRLTARAHELFGLE
jgi:hypothetical protein